MKNIKRARLRQAGIIIVSLVALVLAWYLASVPVKEVRADYGGNLVEGITGAPGAVNPLLSQLNDADKDLVSLIFSGLTKLDGRGEIVPDLAGKWDISLDGRTYTFHLRPGVVWHDGAPFNADDVIFTIDTLKNPDFPGLRELSSLWKTVTATKVDDLTVTMTLKNPYSPFLAYTTLGILPSHILSNSPVKDLKDNPFNTSPIGTGPFKLKEASAEHAVLDANQAYFLGRPYLSSIELRFFSDYASALSALERKEIHSVFSRKWLSDDEMSRLNENPNLSVYTSQRTSYSLIFLNLSSPFFQDKNVRQALLLGLDRRKIINDYLGGQGIIANSPLVPGTWAYDDQNTTKYEFDPEKAKALLDAAGWKQAEGSNVRSKDGTEFKFSLLTNDDKSRISVGEEIVREWRNIGVRAELSSSGPTRLFKDFLIPRKYQAVLYGLDLGNDPDPYAVWHSSQNSENGFNFSGFSNEKADKILEKARQTVAQGARADLYGEFQALFSDEVPSILLYYPTYTYAVDNTVKGVNVGVLLEPSSRFFNIKDWYLKTREIDLPRPEKVRQ